MKKNRDSRIICSYSKKNKYEKIDKAINNIRLKPIQKKRRLKRRIRSIKMKMIRGVLKSAFFELISIVPFISSYNGAVSLEEGGENGFTLKAKTRISECAWFGLG